MLELGVPVLGIRKLTGLDAGCYASRNLFGRGSYDASNIFGEAVTIHFLSFSLDHLLHHIHSLAPLSTFLLASAYPYKGIAYSIHKILRAS